MLPIKKLIDMDVHHIHRLTGFYVLDEVFSISVESEFGFGNVFINKKYDVGIAALIKSLVKLDLIMYGEYVNNKDYYVTMNSLTKKYKRQTAGTLFPLQYMPYVCDDVQVTIAKKIAPCYTEPSVEYVISSGAKTYDELVLFHKKYGHPYFDFVISTLNDGNFRQYKKILLTEHLLNNAFAHNGIGTQSDIDKLFELLQSDDLYTLETIHSLCHIYDLLYMVDPTTIKFREGLQTLKDYAVLTVDEMELNCLMRFINKGAANFLSTTADGKYILPYTIKPEAMDNKKRQYSRNCSTLLHEFKEQICYGRPVPPWSSTVNLPNTT